jgi:NADP-dependent 3-hydroxy acid dehydrogenase YdfG
MSLQTANHMRLDSKVAVITGGAQGVGLGIAQEFIDSGRPSSLPTSTRRL